MTKEASQDKQPQEKNNSKKIPILLGEKINILTFLGQPRFQALLNYLFILILSFSKYFQNNLNYGSLPRNCEIMKFCNLGGDQSFET